LRIGISFRNTQTEAIIPWISFCKKSKLRNANMRFSKRAAGFVLRATQDIMRGEEIVVSIQG